MTKDRYIEILQKFLNQRPDIKYEILKIIYGLNHIMRIKIQTKYL